MTEYPTIMFWMGKRVDEMTREELIDAITIMGRQLNSEREQASSEREMWRAMKRWDVNDRGYKV